MIYNYILNYLSKLIIIINKHFQELLILKETSRQISDLSTPLFSILHSKHIEKCLTNIEITPLPIDLIDICNNLNHNVMSDSGVCSDDFEIEQDEKKEILLSINTEKVNEQSKCDNGLSKRIISKRVQRRVLSERKPSCQPSSPCGLDQSRHYKTDLYTDHSSRKNRTLQHSVNRGNAGGFDHEKAVEFLSKSTQVCICMCNCACT